MAVERTQHIRWVFWSTRESIDHDIPSATAIIETIIAVPLYWWVAIYFETYLLLLISAAVAPLVLLRSNESVALGANWFISWDRRGRRIDQMKEISLRTRRSLPVLGLLWAVFVGLMSFVIADHYLEPNSGWWSVLWRGFAIATFGIALSVAVWLAAGVAVGFPGSTAMAAARAVGYGCWLAVGVAMFWVDKRAPLGALVSILPSMYVGFAFGVLVVALLVRIGATLRHPIKGFRNLPRNFRRLTLCTSPWQEPELVPGLKTGDSQFTWDKALTELRNSDSFGLSLILSILMVIWFAPTWLYRITLKSTAWFWWPLAYLGSDLQRARDPDEFRRTTLGSLWAKATIGLAVITIGAFIWVNFIQTEAVFQSNPLLVVFGYVFVIDWSLQPWQLFPIALAVFSVLIVFLVDDAGGQFRYALIKNDNALRSWAELKLGWIEYLARVRLVLFVLFWLIVAGHTLLYFNSLKCWSSLSVNVELWAGTIYGNRLPANYCVWRNPIRAAS